MPRSYSRRRVPAFQNDPSLDYGGLYQRVPARVVAPTTTEDLARALAELATARTPYKLRAQAHTSSGEVLSDGGAVVALAGLTGVVGDDPEREQITALGGTTWLELWEHLAPQGRRPLALTTNPRVTLAGTTSVGGVGESSHVHSVQAASVRRAVLVTPTGQRRELAAGDPLLAHALCSHGVLGALAEITVATRRATTVVAGNVWRWGGLAELLEDLGALPHDYVRARVVWNEGMVRAWMIVGDSTGATGLPRPRYAIDVSPPERVDLLAHLRVDPSARWAKFNPCCEVVLPYPDGLPALRRIDTRIVRGPLVRYLPRGSSLQLVTGAPELPVCAFRAPRELVFAIRPEPPTHEEALACEAPLRDIADEAFAAGGRVYLTSFPLAADQLARQLDGAAGTLARYKRELDPDLLCNTGNLFGWIP